MTPPVSLVHAEAISEEQPSSSSPQLLEEFYLRYRAPLLKLCAFWTKDPYLAEDLVHETILKAYLAIASYNPRRPVWPWIVTIARRASIDHLRRAGAVHPSPTPTATGLDRYPVDETVCAVISRFDQKELRSRLSKLPIRQRRALLLYAVEGWSYSDIASLESISIKAARQLVVRARKTLRSPTSGQVPKEPERKRADARITSA